MEALANLLGVGVDEISYGVGLSIVFPLSYIHRRMTDVTSKHIFSLIAGVAIAFLVFGWNMLHFVFSSTLVLLMVKILPWRVSPWVVFVYCMAHLSYGHIVRQYYHYMEFGLDWSLVQMILTCKLTAFAWSVHDGHIPVEKIKVPEQVERRIVQLPSLLEYYSWIFFFAGFLTGPFAELNHYLSFTSRKTFEDNNGQIPTSYYNTSMKVLLSVVSYFGVSYNAKYSEFYMVTEEFLTHSLLYRIGYLFLSVELGFFKYYFAFSMGEAACNIAGITYNGKDPKTGRAKWDKILMVRLYEFKTAQNPKVLIENWNIGCQLWLRHSVFLRMRGYIGGSLARFFTFVISAFWHGFYPGYYLFFISCSLISLAAPPMNKYVRPFFMNEDGTPKPTKVLYDGVGLVLVLYSMDYYTLGFRLLSFEGAIKGWSSVYFFCHFGGAAAYVFATAVGRLFPRKKKV